jgi:hypothetical protein
VVADFARAKARACHGSLGSVLSEMEGELLFGRDEVRVVIVAGLDRDPVDPAKISGACL